MVRVLARILKMLVQKSNSHLSHVLEDELLGKYVVITPKNSSEKFLPVQIGVFQETACPKDGSWLRL